MERHHGSQPIRTTNAMQQGKHAFRGCWIKTLHRLISEDQFRLLHQCAGNPNPLLLAAGKLIRAYKGLIQKANAFQSLKRQALFLRAEGQEPAQSAMIAKPPHEHIAEDRDPCDQLMLLKDHSGFAPMAPQGPRFGDIVTTAIEHTALGWPHKTIKRPKKF
jgi:hypothetical protein